MPALSSDIIHDVKNDLKVVRRIRYSLWHFVCMFAFFLLVAGSFTLAGRFDLAMPSVMTLVVFGIAIGVKWNLRHYRWLWATIGPLVGLHILLIVSIPWTSKWIPGPILTIGALVDLILVLAIVNAVGRSVSHRNEQRRRQP